MRFRVSSCMQRENSRHAHPNTTVLCCMYAGRTPDAESCKVLLKGRSGGYASCAICHDNFVTGESDTGADRSGKYITGTGGTCEQQTEIVAQRRETGRPEETARPQFYSPLRRDGLALRPRPSRPRPFFGPAGGGLTNAKSHWMLCSRSWVPDAPSIAA